MILTEGEARKKWCPMVRIKDEPPEGISRVSFNRDYGDRHFYDTDGVDLGWLNGETNCIASDCMMWRWEDQEKWIDRIEQAKKVSGMSTQETADLLPRQGFCGIGGKP